MEKTRVASLTKRMENAGFSLGKIPDTLLHTSVVALEGITRHSGQIENILYFLSDHEYVGLTASLQQGQGARVMAIVYSLVQSCFTLLQTQM